jgi:hypothetical protein
LEKSDFLTPRSAVSVPQKSDPSVSSLGTKGYDKPEKSDF